MSWLAIAAGILQLGAHIPLYISILRRKTKPSTTATGIWAVLSFTLLVSSLASGAHSNIPYIIAGCSATTGTFLLSLKYGYRRWSLLDPICALLAAAGIATWVITSEAQYSVYISSLVDWLALMPVIYKSWLDPSTESSVFWRINLLASIFLIMSIQDSRLVILAVALTQLFHSIIINTILIAISNRYQKTTAVTPY